MSFFIKQNENGTNNNCFIDSSNVSLQQCTFFAKNQFLNNLVLGHRIFCD